MGKIKKIILHWTAGAYEPNTIDKNSYQLLIDGQGVSSYGTNPHPASCGGLNSITYNIALCCNNGYQSPQNQGKYPMNRMQFEAMCYWASEKCKQFNLKPSDCLTHYEIGLACKNQEILKICPWNRWLSQNIGKIDITFLPFEPGIKKDDIGDFIRKKIKWYFIK